jgi:hypothetical protein
LPLSRGVAGPDVGVADTLVEDVPVEGGLELRPLIGLDLLDAEWQPGEHVVEELDRGLLV